MFEKNESLMCELRIRDMKIIQLEKLKYLGWLKPNYKIINLRGIRKDDFYRLNYYRK